MTISLFSIRRFSKTKFQKSASLKSKGNSFLEREAKTNLKAKEIEWKIEKNVS